jgi:hypothetical protein
MMEVEVVVEVVVDMEAEVVNMEAEVQVLKKHIIKNKF